VPVILIFTKFDALRTKAFAILQKEKHGRSEALRLAPGRAASDFEPVFVEQRKQWRYPPKDHVILAGVPPERCEACLAKPFSQTCTRLMQVVATLLQVLLLPWMLRHFNNYWCRLNEIIWGCVLSMQCESE